MNDRKTPNEKRGDAEERPRPAPEIPAAGPHAKPELTNPEATPGAGLLPDPSKPAEEADSASS